MMGAISTSVHDARLETSWWPKIDSTNRSASQRKRTTGKVLSASTMSQSNTTASRAVVEET